MPLMGRKRCGIAVSTAMRRLSEDDLLILFAQPVTARAAPEGRRSGRPGCDQSGRVGRPGRDRVFQPGAASSGPRYLPYTTLHLAGAVWLMRGAR